MDLLKTLENIMSNLSEEKHGNVGNLIDYFEELKIELMVKRDQVKQLSDDLEISNTKLQTTVKDLSKTMKSYEEIYHNFNLVNTKLQNIIEELNVMKRQNKSQEQQLNSMTSEIETLKEANHRLSKENFNLLRNIDAMSVKINYHTLYKDQINLAVNNFKSSITDIKNMCNKITKEQEQVKQIGEKSEVMMGALDVCRNFQEQNERLKKEKLHFEQLYIKNKAKLTKLESLLNQNSELIKPTMLTDKIIDQWQEMQSNYKTTIIEKDEMLKVLSEELQKEKDCNSKLVHEIAILKEDKTNRKLY